MPPPGLLLAVLGQAGAFAAPRPLLGILPEDAPVHLGIALKLPDQDGLQRLLSAQQDPRSPSYHAWLEPETFGDRFGVAPADYTKLAAWFTDHGFEVMRYPSRLFLEAVGRVDALRATLGVKQRYAESRGRRFRTFDGEVQLPAGFRERILHISGLDTQVRLRHRLDVTFQGQTMQVLGPADLRLQYDLLPLMAGGAAAAGLTTVVLDTQEGTSTGSSQDCADSTPGPPFIPPSTDAIQAYLALAGATAIYNPIVLPNPDDDFDYCGSNEEAQLDVEMQSVGAANGASIDLVLSPASTVFSTGAAYIANSLPKATSVSLSIGVCESDEAASSGGGPTSSGSEMQAFEQTVMQGVAEGQTWFAASGDTGADDCDDQASGTHNGFGGGNATVDFPGSLPEMVDVGGTQLSGTVSWSASGNLTAVTPEVAWNEQESLPPDLQSLQPGAGGGGQSRYYAKPSYQQGVGPEALDGARDVPDIALIAASNTPGVAIYDCGTGQDQTCAGGTTGAGPIDIYGGTSVASPLAAGIFALISGKIGCRFGDIHTALYSLGKAQSGGGAQVFHDLTMGNNTFTDPAGISISGFSAGPGFDLMTGWGSLDGAALAANWPICLTKSVTTTGCGSGSGGSGEALLIWLPLVFVVRRLRRRRAAREEGPRKD